MLDAKNPQAPKNLTYYEYSKKKFKTDELIDTINHLVIHFGLEGDLIWKESNEYKI